MVDFNFLSREELFENKLKEIEKIGTKAALTDFAILRGARVVKDCYLNFDNPTLDTRTGSYWTMTQSSANSVSIVRPDGSKENCYPACFRDIAARPVLSYSSLDALPVNIVSEENGIQIVKFGTFPQMTPSKEIQMLLNQESSLPQIGNFYTIDSREGGEFEEEFLPQKIEGIEYNCKRYVQVEANFSHYTREQQLSNGEVYKNGELVWIEVSDLYWINLQSIKKLLSLKLLFAGIQFNPENGEYWFYKNSNIKNYLDNCFAKEIMLHSNLPVDEIFTREGMKRTLK